MRRVFLMTLQRFQQSLPGLYQRIPNSLLRTTVCGAWLALSLAIIVPTTLQLVRGDAPAAEDETPIAHGKYLVHHVAQCVQCHSPRDEQGTLLDAELLTGAVIPVDGPASMRPWASVSVSLVGLGNYDESFVRYLLAHGQRPDGTHPKSPMPSFRLNDRDVDAVIAYLKSLPDRPH